MSGAFIGRREFLTTASGTLIAGTASQSAAAQSADGPTVFVGSDALYAVDATTGEQEWVFSEPSGLVTSSPTVVDGTVYVGARGTSDNDREDAALYAVDAATGEQEWVFTEPSSYVSSSPTVWDGTVYVGSNDETLYAVDTATGEQEWAFTEPSGRVDASPMVVDGIVYIGSSGIRDNDREDTALYAVDAATGEQEWTFTEPDNSVYSSPTVWNATVYVGSGTPSDQDGTLYAVDAATGEQEWAFTEPSVGGLSSPTVWDGTVYVGSHDETLYAVDAAEGTQEWAFTEPSDVVRSPPTVVDGTVFVGSYDNTLYAVDAATGDREWAFTEPSVGGLSSPTVWDGTVYVGSSDDTLYAVDMATGEQEWAFTKPSNGFGSSPTVVEDPASGDSIGSRVRLGTLGHHDDWAYDSQSIGIRSGDSDGLLGSTEMLAVGGGGGLVTLLGLYAFMRDSEETDQQPANESDGQRQPADDRISSPSGSTNDSNGQTASDRIDDHFIDNEHTLDEAKQADQSGEDAESEFTQVPPSIPGAPRLSVIYEAIQKGEAIGKGGNADVYYATVTTDEVEYEFALKQPRMSGTLHTDTVERMLEEAETWRRLDDHDHIVSVVDFGSEPLPWIAMEYMDGGHLGGQAGDLAIDQALWTSTATAEAVHHAHRRGVAHLDLKPENVLFRSVEDAWDVPKVADWGLSKHLLEHSKSVEGFSPQYAAPEQFDDNYGDTDDITDVYQLGAVFYELFTGQPPFEGKPAMVMNKVLNKEPAPPSAVADVPTELDDVLQPALAKQKDDRYESVLYLRDELEDLFESL